MNLRACHVGLLGVCATVFCSLSTSAGTTIYVDWNSTGTPDGDSWDTAYHTLTEALAEATSGDEIHVADGTYTPHTSDRDASFEMKSGVAVLGGYAGDGAVNRDAHDPGTYITILSGDLLGDDNDMGCDGPFDPDCTDDNSYHVVTALDVDAASILDGFTICAGNAVDVELPGDYLCNARMINLDAGGGMVCLRGCPTIRNCRFIHNHAKDGGGMSLVCSNATLALVRFEQNAAYPGVPPQLDSGFNCNEMPCFTDLGEANGGGVHIFGGLPRIDNCEFIRNFAGHVGGGVAAQRHFPSPTLSNCAFCCNVADDYGGGLRSGISASVIAVNCTFSKNIAKTGAGFSMSPAGVTSSLDNCVLWGNVAPEAASGMSPDLAITGGMLASPSLTVSYSNVDGRQTAIEVAVGATLIWGDGNINEAPLFVDDDECNLRLNAGSRGIDEGSDALVLTDDADVDGDSVTTGESVPWDVDRNNRFLGPSVDMGAYENEVCSADFDDSGSIGGLDLASLLGKWGPCQSPCPEDLDGNSVVNGVDLALYLSQDSNCP